MVRTTPQPTPPSCCFPHARGDGPDVNNVFLNSGLFSPRPWGWSASACGPSCGGSVFPTPVGMVREIIELVSMYRSFPHARGDGPKPNQPDKSRTEFSPRPWGWSAKAVYEAVRVWVFPTPVGMVREKCWENKGNNSFPHARGDGPMREKTYDGTKLFSPRPWGWSGI